MSEELSRKLKYQFNDPKLLKVALTHRSSHDLNNERLEFLGDSIVNSVITEALFHQFPHAQEGHLSRWRATLINRDTLGNLAREFDLGRYLILGPGELKSGGSDRQSILSCTMEAIIGAIYLDSDFNITRDCILRWYESLLRGVSHAQEHKDPKTLLQEYLQSISMPLPIYTVENIDGEAHQQTFTVSCKVEGIAEGYLGKGSSRKKAEQEAASLMLGALKK